MNIESMANYADIVGGVAVIVSLIYVGIQIRLNTKSNQTQANQNAHDSLAILSLEVGKDPDLTSFWRKGAVAFDELTEEEQFRFMMLMVTLFRRFENIFYQYQKGFLEEDLWGGYRQAMLAHFYTSGGQAFWNVRAGQFSRVFQNYLDSTSPDDANSEMVT
jgi:hypothetical protein